MAEGGVGKPVPTRGRLPEYEKIQNNFTFLQDELSSRPDDLASAMFSRNIIDKSDLEKIRKREKQGTKAVVGEILHVLLGCGPGAYDKFIDCLQETNNIEALRRLEPDVARRLIGNKLNTPAKCFPGIYWGDSAMVNTLGNILPNTHLPLKDGDIAFTSPDFARGLGKSLNLVDQNLTTLLPLCNEFLNRDQQWEDDEKAARRSGNRPQRRPSPKVVTSFNNKFGKGLKVFVYQEDVVGIHANILVCYKYGTSKHEGRIAKRLREEGGEKYVESLENVLKGTSGLKEWRMYRLDAGDLQFSEVYQAIIAPNPTADGIDDWLSNFQHLYQFILSEADKRGYKSITFPVANADCIEKCIDILVSSIKKHESSNLRKVNIVTTEDKTIGKIRRCLQTEGSTTATAKVDNTNEDFGSNISIIEHPPHKLSNALVVHLRKADIVDVLSGVIVTSTHGKAETEGKIAKRLRQIGGVEYVKSLENLVRNIDGFEDWEIYTSDPGELLFNEVFQVIIPPNPPDDAMDDWLSELQGLNSLILTTADARGYTSITLPVLGSGETGTEAEKCIEGLKKALEEYAPQNFLQDVYVVTRSDFIFTLLRTSLQKQN